MRCTVIVTCDSFNRRDQTMLSDGVVSVILCAEFL